MGGVVKAITNVVKAVVNVVTSVVKSVINFVGDVIGFVVNPFGSFDTPNVPDPGQAAQGVQVSKPGTNNALPVVYGFRRVGGNIIFAESNGTSNRYLYIVYAICEGEIFGVQKLVVNDVELPTVGTVHNHGQVYSVSDGRFSGRMTYQIFNGTENQVQSSLANETPTWPTKNRRLPGIAYCVCRFEWKEITTQAEADQNPYSGGIPNVTFDVYGKKVYDVRTHGSGKTLSGSYASRSKQYNFNPANCLLDYLENPRYGAGLKTTEIDAEAFKIAANKYEQTVQYSNTQTGRALTMNAVVNTGNKILDNVKTLVAGCRGIMPYIQGRYKLKVEDGGNATDISSTTISIAYDVTNDHIVGGITLDGERKSSKYNQVIVNYVDPDIGFTNQQVVYNKSGDQTIDNDEPLTGEFTFHTVNNPAMARDLAQMIYDKSRKQTQISFKATQELLAVEIGDIIRVTDTILDLNQATYRVTGMKLNPDGLVDIEAVEHDATLYPFTKGPQIEVPPSVFIPDDYQIKPYVKPLPAEPLSVRPPLDPDFDSAGAVIEVNAPPDAPDAGKKVTGINAFDNYQTKYPAKAPAYIMSQFGKAPGDLIIPFAPFSSALTYYDEYGVLMNGSNGFAYVDSTNWRANSQWDANFYRMTRHGNLSYYGGYSFVFRVVRPLDTRIVNFIIRGYKGQELKREVVLDLTLTYGSKLFDGTYSTLDPYTLAVNRAVDVILPVWDSETDWVWEARWGARNGEFEFQDDSDLNAVSGWTGHAWRDRNGISQRKKNIEAYVNWVASRYHLSVSNGLYPDGTTVPRTGSTVTVTSDLGA